MKNIFQLVVFASVLVLVQGCGFQIDCPDFNTKLLEWVPYQNHDTIRLRNVNDDSILVLAVNEIYVEHTTHYVINEKCGTCDDFIKVNQNETIPSDLRIFIYLNKNQFKSQGYEIQDSYFAEYNTEYSEQADYTFEGVLYDHVRVFEKNPISEGFNKLIIAKGIGIVGLVDHEGNNWILTENPSESGNKEPVEIRNISC